MIVVCAAPRAKSKVLSPSWYVTVIPVSVLELTIAPTVSEIVSANVAPAIVIASASSVPSIYASLNWAEELPKSILSSVDGIIAPSINVSWSSLLALTVITFEPEKVIDVSVSPSPAIESNCKEPIFVISASLKSKLPVTSKSPPTDKLPATVD